MWEARFATTASAKGWEELKGALSTHVIGGRTLDQWQYEVTGGGRIWYCPDGEARVVWIVMAGTAHPKATD